MTARAKRLLDRIDRARGSVLDLASGLAPEQLVFRPEPSSWSALDVVEHLMRVEEAIATRVKPRPPRTWREAIRGRLFLELISLSFLLGRRFRAPGQVILPEGGVTLTDVGAKWEAAGQMLRRTIDGFGPADYARPMMRHPFVGLLTPIETLTFILRHIAHHRRQIIRIRRSAGYPLER